MKISGLIIGSFAVAATASAAVVCDSPDCSGCQTASNPTLWAVLALAGGLVVGRFGFKVFSARRAGGVGGIVAAFALLLAFAGNSFAEDKNASGTNAVPEKVTIAELLATPDAYAGKQVTVQARLAGVCAGDGCLTLKDKLDMIEGLPPAGGFKRNPKAGSVLNVTGTVKVRGSGENKAVAITVTDFEEVKK